MPNIPDMAKAFSIAFFDFDPGETFSYNIDVDINAGGSISGSRLIGAKVYFDFDNGTRSEGFLRAVPGRPTASTFVTERVIETGVPEPATWALMIAGFGLAGSAVRRARSRALAV
ncbi:MAG: PEPxxWA-CTERM sorting domain-containing protein [Alphaproteobacteria bacterium]|nr:PEPxxWA-CTERM sorting domain-containing protein [Alphaproteobacteria bacterium]MBU1516729.1 PEPxxWA-CTERM sorting domain-containing protein [Alphaproteobacteria bacterium]MBU2095897.1 PEPxxWA-CTERM sorting domain-containing protein [Alphaproteobacteria bacterium]MBU2153601.1 PEPxxWA-CTERM sorting domain-containing protein [Alphaproteobacteria bacterium]MBU2307355.1 PEPxxWA-CTERM sorting domain-containing protein [Alphaproteobacteria bacterium]